VALSGNLKIRATLLPELIILGFLLTVSVTARCQDDNRVLFDADGTVLVGSRFGPLARFQLALSKALESCNRIPLAANGRFDKRMHDAILELTHCPEDLGTIANSSAGRITVALWRSLLPDDAIPSVRDRSFVLWLSHEGTDYDQAEWNLGTSDDASVLTWGPYGATIGYGNEVRGILRNLVPEQSALLSSSFESEYDVMRNLLSQPATSGYAILKPVFDNEAKREKWIAIFKKLGADHRVRDAYDQYAFNSDKWLKPALRKLYKLLSDQSFRATEIDFAFFVDLAMHMSITEARIGKARAALLAAKVDHPLSPAERRHLLSKILVPTNQQKDRMGRNVVYFIDGIGIGGLSAREKDAWAARSGRKASQCGLSDEREFWPNMH
jgi:hypothetical protein